MAPRRAVVKSLIYVGCKYCSTWPGIASGIWVSVNHELKSSLWVLCFHSGSLISLGVKESGLAWFVQYWKHPQWRDFETRPGLRQLKSNGPRLSPTSYFMIHVFPQALTRMGLCYLQPLAMPCSALSHQAAGSTHSQGQWAGITGLVLTTLSLLLHRRLDLQRGRRRSVALHPQAPSPCSLPWLW